MPLRMLRCVLAIAMLAVVARAHGQKSPSSAASAAEEEEEIVIVAERSDEPAAGMALDAEQARIAPGTHGDPLNVVQSLPGVAILPAPSGELVVWGAAPAETRFYFDGVPAPALYHKGGLRSVMHPAMVGSIELEPAAYGPERGRALGGVVEIDTEPLALEGLQAEIAADAIGAGAFLRKGGDAYAAGAGGRVGYLEHVLSLASSDIEEIVPLSAHRDYVAKASLGHGDERLLELLAFGSFDDVERVLPSADPNARRAERDRRSFHRVAATYVRYGEEGHRDSAGLWVGHDDSSLASNFDDIETRLSVESLRYGGRATRLFELDYDHALVLGIEAEGSYARLTREGTLGLPAREGDTTAFGQAPAGQVAADEWTHHLVTVAGYTQLRLRFAERAFEVRPGLRVEPIVQAGDRVVPASGGPRIGYSKFDLAFGPRLEARWSVSENVTLRLATGLYSQPPTPVDLSPVFGGTEIEPASALHWLGSVSYRAWSATTLEATGFVKSAWGLVARTEEESPSVARALVGQGQARIVGGQLVARQRLWNDLSGWVSYGISRSERRDAPAASWRKFDFDQTHQIIAVASYALSSRWEVGARFAAATGLPRSEVIGAYYDARLDRFQPQFGAHNGIRLSPLFQVDLRAEWKQSWQRSKLSVYAELLNVTNQRNPVELTYNHDFSERGSLTSLPTLVVIGARLRM